MQNYLFVHFKETTSPEGEQVYFAVSRDGFTWEALNGGNPILWAYYGDKGVRDMTIVRDVHTGRFHIFATDLSLAYGLRGKYAHSWDNIKHYGSKCLAHWESPDLVNWTEEELLPVADESFGCVWAPDILYDKAQDDYILHWSSSTADNGYFPMGIFYSRTRDFKTYSAPALLYRKEKDTVIDSAMYEENGKYYLFIKSQGNPKNIQLLVSDTPTGGFQLIERFDESVKDPEEGKYEAPTAVKLDDGRWALFLDFYGTWGKYQGYVPFLSDDLPSGVFRRADGAFRFPYRFKHGTILTITEEECDRMLGHDWTKWKDGR